MEFGFDNKHLIDLYTLGASRKYKFIDKKMAALYVERINRIEAATTIFDLRDPPSMKFEALAGYQNRFSIRINQQCRLEFEIQFNNDDKTAGTVRILDVTKHYK